MKRMNLQNTVVAICCLVVLATLCYGTSALGQPFMVPPIEKHLVVMKLSTRRIEIAGITTNPNAAWTQQMGRNLTDYDDGFLNDINYLLLDRDTKFLPFSGTLEGMDTKVVLLPPRSPNLNAFVERYMRSMKSECLDKLIFFGENSLRRALAEFTEHYHHERNHQGLENNIIDFNEETTSTNGDVQRRERLGGMLSYYYRDAA